MSACNRPGNMALRAALLSSVALVFVAGLSHPADAAVRKAAKTTLDRSAARSAMFPGRLQADIAAFLLLLRQRPRKNPPFALPGEHITETRVEREGCLSPSRSSWTTAIAFVARARASVHKEATIAAGVKGPSLLPSCRSFMGEPRLT